MPDPGWCGLRDYQIHLGNFRDYQIHLGNFRDHQIHLGNLRVFLPDLLQMKENSKIVIKICLIMVIFWWLTNYGIVLDNYDTYSNFLNSPEGPKGFRFGVSLFPKDEDFFAAIFSSLESFTVL